MRTLNTLANLLIAFAAIALATGFVVSSHAQTNAPEPIAYIGHGGFFDAQGRQIEMTPEFIAKAQAYYRKKLLTAAVAGRRDALKSFEGELTKGLKLQKSDQLVAQQRALTWFAASAPAGKVDPSTLGKLRALDYLLGAAASGKPTTAFMKVKPFKLNPDLALRLDNAPAASPGGPGTVNSGQAYIDECSAAGVPIPPPIGQLDPNGRAGWKTQGFIPQAAQFIVGTPAELRSYETDTGLCFALPRYEDDSKATVALDGVICLGKTTGKTCFWDNQMSGSGFPFPSGTLIPIGVANLAVNPEGKYQAGGAELEGGDGGVCTECHAGENPFVIHPKANLGGVLMGSLSAFSPDRYSPLVAASWWLNQDMEPEADVPDQCGACHTQDDAGRFPKLSAVPEGYCATILRPAIARTMPPSKPGAHLNTPEVVAFLARCGKPA
ncbi:hypothetical protein [Caulobacter segnis]|uniref:hypothetical protein n=1 Tax=Caulobacter segnis TaxID=88688 RepID=UPI001CBBB970|nr:hypothetical protein [Caulobacter segnis]UAL09969.1 hypothetical protein K8940_19705 [Caulobacter segnis]